MADPQVDLDALLEEDEEDSIFTSASAGIIKAAGLGTNITNALGATPVELGAAEAFLIARIIDNSGSISGLRGGEQAICNGANVYHDTFAGAKAEEGILMGTWLVNEENPIQPFVSVDSVVKLEVGKNYRGVGYTPLYRQIYTVMAAMLVKMDAEYYDAGIPCRGILIGVTDGHDEDGDWRGNPFTASMVANLYEEIGHERLIFQLMGVGDAANWKTVGEEMGVEPQHIIESTTDPHDIREKFHMASKSAQSASKSAGNFSATAGGGFTVTP